MLLLNNIEMISIRIKSIIIGVISIISSFTLAQSSTSLFDYNDIQEYRISGMKSKYILLYFYFDGCAPCVKMERTTFKEETIREFINQYFISVKINTLKEVNIEVKNKYEIGNQPAYVIIDSIGNVIHKFIGYYDPLDFKSQLSIALENEITYPKIKELYDNGLRDKDILYKYTYLQRNLRCLEKDLIHKYLNSLTYEELLEDQNIKYIYDFMVFNFESVISIEDNIYGFIVNHKELFLQIYEQDQIDARLFIILRDAIVNSLDEMDSVKFFLAIKEIERFQFKSQYILLGRYKEILGMVGINYFVEKSKLRYYKERGSIKSYEITLDEYFDAMKDDVLELDDFAFEMTYKSEPLLEKEDILLLMSLRRLIELKPKYSYFINIAKKHFERKEYSLSLDYLNQGIEIASRDGIDIIEAKNLITTIKGIVGEK